MRAGDAWYKVDIFAALRCLLKREGERVLRTENQVRAAIERQAGGKLREGVWQKLVRARFISEALGAEDEESQDGAIVGAAEEALELDALIANPDGVTEEKAGRAATAEPEAALRLDFEDLGLRSRRVEHLRRAAVREALRHPEVRRLRQQLGDLTPADVLRHGTVQAALRKLAQRRRRSLELERLLLHLSDRYGWSRAGSSLVMAGGAEEPPFQPVTDVRIRRGEHAVLDRVDVSFHPGLRSRDVLDLVTNAWKRAGVRRRDFSEQALAMVAFLEKVNDGRSWQDALAAWNRTHRGYRRAESQYAWRTFSRDCRAAWKRVIGKPLVWKGQRGPKARGPKAKGRGRAARWA